MVELEVAALEGHEGDDGGGLAVGVDIVGLEGFVNGRGGLRDGRTLPGGGCIGASVGCGSDSKEGSLSALVEGVERDGRCHAAQRQERDDCGTHLDCSLGGVDLDILRGLILIKS